MDLILKSFIHKKFSPYLLLSPRPALKAKHLWGRLFFGKKPCIFKLLHVYVSIFRNKNITSCKTIAKEIFHD